MPNISIIIPVYNVAKYLQRCIDSLISQTISDKTELIFVNDASPDNCLEILRYNEKRYPGKIIVIDSPENLSQGGARNLGIRRAKGEYIGFVDSDDFVAPSMYEKLYDKALSSDADAVFIQYASVTDDEIPADAKPIIEWDEALLRLEGKNLSRATNDEISDFIAFPVGGIYCGLWRKSIITDNNIFFPEHVKYEDNYWGTLIRLYLRKIAFIHEVTYFYRQNPTSTVHTRNISFITDRITVENKLLDEAKKRGFLEPYKSAWEYLYAYRYAFRTSTFYAFMSAERQTFGKIIDDLRREFPSWRRNKYYRRERRISHGRNKILLELFTLWPEFLRVLIRLYVNIRDGLRHFALREFL